SMPGAALAFGESGCGAGECRDCHSLNAKEAMKLLPPGADKINSVDFSEVGGLWRVEGEAQGKKFNLYIDFSKQYIIAGDVIRIRDGADVSHKVDVSEIPAAGGIVLGNPEAPLRIHVFSDVLCPHCDTLHQHLETLVEENQQVQVMVHLLPLMMEKELAAALGCSNSADMLRVAYSSRGNDSKLDDLEPCAHTDVDAVIDFARKWQLNSTPSMILPDGQVVRGSRSLERIEQMLEPYLE
ncbi:MAG: thioredoxin domain-containing protein, partial [Geobacteraceae bacterium]|nr:thioredoxin domain-containing protein [Geobacteraceae bacterium]